MRKLLIMPLIFLIFSCSSSLKIQESYHSENINFDKIKNSKISICGVSSISLDEFIKTFNDEYSDSAKLDNKIISTFSSEFKKIIPSVTPVEINEKIPAELSGEFSFKENNSEEVSEFFNSLETDYLIFVNNISVGNAYNTYFYPTSYGMMSGGQTENCVVSIEVELWDVDQQKRLMKFRAGGVDEVFFFAYLSALNGAIERSVTTAVSFINKDGKIK
jgi:hypothetical protein